jgi:hypothetical protein
MGCPICDNKPANCDCTATEREQFDEIETLRTEIARLREEMRRREALWTACADQMQLVYGNALRPKPLPPRPEGDA